jgi:PAS domain S-box-containing protein
MVRIFSSVCLFWLIAFTALAQNDPRDSLHLLLEKASDKRQKVDLLNELAYQNFDIDDSAAMRYANEALKLAKQFRYVQGQQYANTLLGLGLSSAGKRKEAVKFFETSEAISAGYSRPVRTYNLVVWGILCTELAKYDSAELLFMKARANALPTDYADLQSIYKNLGRLNALRWRHEKAKLFLDSAQQLVKYGDLYMEMEILSQLLLVYQNSAEFDKAEVTCRHFCELAQQGADYFHKVECALFMSRMMMMKGEFAQALKFGLEALKQTSRYNFSQYVEVLTQIGEVYLELSQFELSGQYLYQALKVSEEAGLRMRTANLYVNLAWLAKIEGQYQQALGYCDKAQDLYRAIGDEKGEADAHNIRGLTFFLMNAYAKTEQQYEKALLLRKKINDIKGVSATLYNQAELLHAQKKSNQAIHVLKQVVEIEQKIGNLPYLAMTYGIMARVLTDQKKFTEAQFFLSKAQQTGEAEQSLVIKRDNTSHFAYYYEAVGDYRNAFDQQKQYQQLSEQIYSQHSLDKLAEYESLYKAETRTKEIELLREKQKNQEQELRLQYSKLAQKNTVIIAVLVIAIFLGVASIRVSQLNANKEAANKKLKVLNEEVSLQRDDIKQNLDEIQTLKDSLEIREKQYRGLVEGANDIIHELDQNGKFAFVNSAIERITGYQRNELLGLHFSHVIHPDYRAFISKVLIDQVAANEQGSYIEFPVVAKNGSAIWLGQNTSFYYHQGKLKRVSVVARDITKQKNIEQELLKSQHEYESLVDSVPVGIYKAITYPNGEFAFLYVSPRWCQMNGVKMNDVLKNPLPVNELIHPADRPSFREAEVQAKINNYRFVWEGRVVIDGQTKYMRIESRGQKLPNGNIIRNGIQQDITERKLAEIEMLRARQAAEKAYAVKSDFIANISHEMRTPLNGIIGFTDLLSQSPLSKTQEKYIEQVSKSSAQLLIQIDNLLDFAKMESGKMITHRLPANLRVIALMVAKQFEIEARAKKLKLTQRVTDSVPLEIVLDEEKIRQVLVSLVSNALKFTLAGSVEILIDQISDSVIRFAVIDTGIGVSPQDLKRIFEPFVQVDSSSTKRYEGTGLGLAIASHVVRLLGSELKVESALGEGSKFYFDLKLSLAVEG